MLKNFIGKMKIIVVKCKKRYNINYSEYIDWRIVSPKESMIYECVITKIPKKIPFCDDGGGDGAERLDGL